MQHRRRRRYLTPTTDRNMKFRQETSPKPPPITTHHPTSHTHIHPPTRTNRLPHQCEQSSAFHCCFMVIITAAFRSYLVYVCTIAASRSASIYSFTEHRPPSVVHPNFSLFLPSPRITSLVPRQSVPAQPPVVLSLRLQAQPLLSAPSLMSPLDNA